MSISKKNNVEIIDRNDIAITGISCKFSQANNVFEFWKNIKNGIDCIGNLSRHRKDDIIQYLKTVKQSNDAVDGQAGFLDRIDLFDHSFFNMSPMEAKLMDPAQRLFLENSWHVIEDAGYNKETISGSNTGVYLGYIADCEYKSMIQNIQPDSISFSLPGNVKPLIVGRISRILDLKGPSMLIDTGCSSSLVAVHTACQAIRNNECDMAIAGGIQIHIIPIRSGNIGIESSTGRTRAFDDKSDGTGTGEGVASVFLKPLEQALADKDSIYAVIKGSAVNHDGKSIGITAPNASAQSKVIIKSWENSGIDPTSIDYIEAHGTGTKLGDYIEAEGIRLAFSKYTNRTGFCAIGSVKSNIGHTDGCAGIAGLIKAALQLHHSTLAPSLHCDIPNSDIDWNNMPIYINTKCSKWMKSDKPRVCGVSSFSLSGTNCHVVLEEAKKPNYDKVSDKHNLFILSANSENSLKTMVSAYEAFLKDNNTNDLKNICHTLFHCRTHYKHRLAIIAESVPDLLFKLSNVYCTNKEELINFKIYKGVSEGNDYHKVASPADKDELEMHNLAKVFISGGNIAIVMKGWKMHLPEYAFEPLRCWLTYEKDDQRYSETYFYKPVWELDQYAGKACLESIHEKRGKALLIHRNSEFSKNVIKCLEMSGIEVVVANPSDWAEKLLDFERNNIEKIINIEDSTTYNSTTNAEKLIILYELHDFIKIISEHNTQMTIITKYAWEVTGMENHVSTGNAALLGLGMGVSFEYPRLHVKLIDIDADTAPDTVINEIYGDNIELRTAYRNNVRFLPGMKEIQPNKCDEISESTSKKTYLITGSSRGIGLEVARYFSRKKNINLCLVARTDKHSREIAEELTNLSRSGCDVAYISTDVADREQLKTSLDTFRKMFGKIDGVFHCAGISGKGLFNSICKEDILEVMKPKVFGAENIYQLLENDKLDFIILFSSLSSIIGGYAQSNYIAANAYLDAFGTCCRKKGTHVTVLNWPAWRDIGMFSKLNNEVPDIFEDIDREKGISILQTVVDNINDMHNVVIGNMKDTLCTKKIISLNYLSNEAKKNIESIRIPTCFVASNHEMILSGRDSTQYSDTEITVANIWNKALGLNGINIYDDFFELGGDSFMIGGMLDMFINAFGEEIGVSDLYQHTTIFEFAKFIDSLEKI